MAVGDNETVETEEKTITQTDIYAHNEPINAAIAELEKEKKKYDEVIRTAGSINGTLDTLIDGASDVNTLLEQIIINGEPIGSNVFSGSIRQRLSTYGDVFTKIISECKTKIEEIDGEIKLKQAELW